MKLASIHIKDFKRFKDLLITGLEKDVKLVILTGPNGSGKTSVFESFNYWSSCVNESAELDREYHFRSIAQQQSNENWHTAWNLIRLSFHDYPVFNDMHSCRNDRIKARKAFYIRSAYRHEADFTTNGLQKSSNILDNTNRPAKLILSESRVSENYQRLAADSFDALYDPQQKKKTAEEITDGLIGIIRDSMKEVFDDLILEGPTNPVNGGTFRFTKGSSSGFHYKNLSGGEKAAFDLLVDFIVKSRAFNETIFCIDEPELHMHTKLQSKLLEQLFKLVPDNCQLWVSTHSIGMARKASELYANHPNEVAFLDFHDTNFDERVQIMPSIPDRRYWKNMFSTALDDLAELVTPKYVVLCEGKKLGEQGRKPSFDVAVYREIFQDRCADLEFLPLGGHSEVQAKGGELTRLMTAIAPGIRMWAVFDRDDRSPQEIAELAQSNVQVLPRRDLENYLWDDDVLIQLCVELKIPEKASAIIDEKNRLLSLAMGKGKPVDDVKAISGELYAYTKRHLLPQLPQGCGNTPEAFAIATLAPVVKKAINTYKDLADVVLAPLKSSTQ